MFYSVAGGQSLPGDGALAMDPLDRAVPLFTGLSLDGDVELGLAFRGHLAQLSSALLLATDARGALPLLPVLPLASAERVVEVYLSSGCRCFVPCCASTCNTGTIQGHCPCHSPNAWGASWRPPEISTTRLQKRRPNSLIPTGSTWQYHVLPPQKMAKECQTALEISHVLVQSTTSVPPSLQFLRPMGVQTQFVSSAPVLDQDVPVPNGSRKKEDTERGPAPRGVDCVAVRLFAEPPAAPVGPGCQLNCWITKVWPKKMENGDGRTYSSISVVSISFHVPYVSIGIPRWKCSSRSPLRSRSAACLCPSVVQGIALVLSWNDHKAPALEVSS